MTVLFPNASVKRWELLERAVEAIEEAREPFTLDDIWKALRSPSIYEPYGLSTFKAAQDSIHELRRHRLIVRVTPDRSIPYGYARQRREGRS